MKREIFNYTILRSTMQHLLDFREDDIEVEIDFTNSQNYKTVKMTVGCFDSFNEFKELILDDDYMYNIIYTDIQFNLNSASVKIVVLISDEVYDEIKDFSYETIND